MILLFLNSGTIDCKGLKGAIKGISKKIDTILSHTGILVQDLLLPISFQIDSTVAFPVEIETITFTDSVNCGTINVDEVLNTNECSALTPRGNCLISSITAKNNNDGTPCTPFQSSGSSESKFKVFGVGLNGCNVTQAVNSCT